MSGGFLALQAKKSKERLKVRINTQRQVKYNFYVYILSRKQTII